MHEKSLIRNSIQSGVYYMELFRHIRHCLVLFISLFIVSSNLLSSDFTLGLWKGTIANNVDVRILIKPIGEKLEVSGYYIIRGRKVGDINGSGETNQKEITIQFNGTLLNLKLIPDGRLQGTSTDKQSGNIQSVVFYKMEN